MTYGLGPFGLSALGLAAPLPTTVVPTMLPSSRAINGDTGRYVFDSNGNPTGMDDLAQQVMLLLAFTKIDTPFLTTQDLNTQRQRALKALEPLTKSDPPQITITSAVFADNGTDTALRQINFVNVATNTKTSVTF